MLIFTERLSYFVSDFTVDVFEEMLFVLPVLQDVASSEVSQVFGVRRGVGRVGEVRTVCV